MAIIGGIMMNKKDNYHLRYASFYNSAEWKALRQAKFDLADGLCEMCKKEGVVRAGKEVHHIIPIEDDWSKRLDFDNLIALCKDCHNEQHNRQSLLKKFLQEFDGDLK